MNTFSGVGSGTDNSFYIVLVYIFFVCNGAVYSPLNTTAFYTHIPHSVP